MRGFSELVARINAVSFTQQRRPGDLGTLGFTGHLDPGRHRFHYRGVDHERCAAGLGTELDRTGGFEYLYWQECVGTGGADFQQAMMSQHQTGFAAQVGLQSWLFVRPQRQASVSVIGAFRSYERRLPADWKQTAFLRAHCQAGAGTDVQDTANVVAVLMDAIMDSKIGRIYWKRCIGQSIVVLIDLDQALRCYCFEHQAIWVDQEAVFGFWNTGTDMDKDQVASSIKRNRATGGGNITTQVPFFLADFVL